MMDMGLVEELLQVSAELVLLQEDSEYVSEHRSTHNCSEKL